MKRDRIVWKQSLIGESGVIDVEVVLWGGESPGLCLTSEEGELSLSPQDVPALCGLLQRAQQFAEAQNDPS